MRHVTTASTRPLPQAAALDAMRCLKELSLSLFCCCCFKCLTCRTGPAGLCGTEQVRLRGEERAGSSLQAGRRGNMVRWQKRPDTDWDQGSPFWYYSRTRGKFNTIQKCTCMCVCVIIVFYFELWGFTVFVILHRADECSTWAARLGSALLSEQTTLFWAQNVHFTACVVALVLKPSSVSGLCLFKTFGLFPVVKKKSSDVLKISRRSNLIPSESLKRLKLF